jgi:hypothetical protein
VLPPGQRDQLGPVGRLADQVDLIRGGQDGRDASLMRDRRDGSSLLVVVAGVIVVFWRTVLRVLIAVLGAALVVGVGAGVLMLFPGIHL